MAASQAGQQFTNTHLTLITLGGAALVYADAGTSGSILRPGKALALLVYLSSCPRRSASRDHLIDLLWADLKPDAARNALRQAIWFIRHRLGDDVLLGEHDELTLAERIGSDRDCFLAAVDPGDSEAAIRHYGGPFLPGFAAPGGADFEQWADLERRRLHLAFTRAAEAAIRVRIGRGRWREATQLARRLRDEDRERESSWRLLIESFLSGGDTLNASLEAEALLQALAAEHRSPEPATQALLDLVRQSPAPAPAGAPQTLVAELVGREQQFSAIIQAWERAARGPGTHVQVSAAPGLGKTRLLNDVHARLRAIGVRAVNLRINPASRHLAYASASDLAQALADLPGATGVSPGATSVLVALNPSLSARYNTSPDSSTGQEALRRRAIAVGELLAAVAYERPIALLIDDVHWIDRASREVLSEAVGKVGQMRVLLVTTTRPTTEGGIHTADSQDLVLPPLSPQDVGALVASLGVLPREPWSEEFTNRLHAATRGSPLLVLETLALALERGTLTLEGGRWQCSDPVALEAALKAGGALTERIARLTQDEQGVLLLLAAAQSPMDVSLLARAAGGSSDVVPVIVDQLERRGLAVRVGQEWQPAHEEIADRAIGSAGTERLRAAHAALGCALAETAGDDAELLHRAGRHLAAAGEQSSLERVYRRWITRRHAHGGDGSLRKLAAELLGDLATQERIAGLAASLPLRWRLGLTTPGRVAAAAAVTLLATAGAFSLVLERSPPAPPDVILVALRPLGGDSSLAVSVPLRRADWSDGRTLDVLSATHAQQRVVKINPGLGASPSPDGKAWVTIRVVPGAGGRELFLVREDGTELRLTDSPEDDDYPSWSPDGRSIVFQTVRWNPRHHWDLAIFDLRTGQTRALTRGESSEGSPYWSPDGTRIAFYRSFLDGTPGETCWISVDGRNQRCWATPSHDAVVIEGWKNNQEVLFSAESARGATLQHIDLETGASGDHLSDLTVHGWRVSPDGRWVACFCQRPGYTGQQWYVYPADRPDLARPLKFGAESPRNLQLLWRPAGATLGYLDRLTITSPAGGLPVDAAYRLQVHGSDRSGEPVAVRNVSWSSSDSTIATVDSTGTVHPIRAGTVVIKASAGGWREDSALVTITPPSWAMVLAERWTGPLAVEWVPYGVPRPLITVGPDDVPSFWHRGDSTFYSGVYSRRAFDARGGLGVEITVSTPITALQWQDLRVVFTGGLESATLRTWDHRTGGPPDRGYPSCGAGYPAGDGAVNLARMVSPAGLVSVDSALRSGRWYKVRLQVFPDGRCAAAINGTPVARSDVTLPLDKPFRLMLFGKSVRTKILVGPLQVWQGVRSDIDWSALDAPRGTGAR